MLNDKNLIKAKQKSQLLAIHKVSNKIRPNGDKRCTLIYFYSANLSPLIINKLKKKDYSLCGTH